MAFPPSTDPTTIGPWHPQWSPPSSHAHPVPHPLHLGLTAPMSPPTPAPSPTPRGKRWEEASETTDTDSQRTIDYLLSLPSSERTKLLNSLMDQLELKEALVVSRRIEPRLRRDFLRQLPMEVALHCLSFVDDARTLARAACVSRYWRSLLEDEAPWKEMCDRHRFQAVISPISSHSTTSHTRKVQNAISELRELQVEAQERVRTPPASLRGKGKARANGDVDEDGFSYRDLFKQNYMTESNWLHGGHIQCTRVGNDSGVVTSLALDGELMVVGMTSHKIHIFRAKTGEFVKSLVGHEAGVWCLILISPGGGTPPKWESPENTDEEDESEEDGPARKGEGEFTFSPSPRLPTRRMNPPSAAATRASMNREPGELASYRDEGLTRRASFNGLRIGHLDPPIQYPIGPPGELMRLPPLGRPAQAPQGSNTPRSARSGLFPGLAGAIPSSSMPSTPRGRESATQEHVLPNFTSGQTPPPTAKPAHRKARRMPQSDVRGSAMGWGQPGAVVVSGSCDRHVRVWDVNTGRCVHRLEGHTSTVRCVKVVDGRPIAVSGSRDFTLRVWDIENGILLHTLEGHTQSVRCIEVAGNQVVSGSYDYTCRLWDIDTGECLHVLSGHYHQIYSVAFDGLRIVTGSLDSTIRVWDASTGECLALLQGHTSLVGNLQLTNNILASSGSDGRVIVFDMSTGECIHRICAHDNSVTCIQFDDRYIVSGSNDGRVKLWNLQTGYFVRELTQPSDAVWRIAFRDDRIVMICQRKGKMVIEVLSFVPGE